jgi:hypothetical protein
MTPGPVVLRCLGLVGSVHGGSGPVPVGAYLVRYDPEAHDGRGDVEWSPDPARAQRFPDVRTALEALRAVPRCRPRRPDGKPNRPLMAFTIAVEPAPPAEPGK